MKTINVYGNKIKIKKVKNLISSENICGRFYPSKSLIEIDSSLTGDKLKVTLIHEIIHATMYRTSLVQANLSYDLHEIIADQIATVVVELFNVNLK